MGKTTLADWRMQTNESEVWNSVQEAQSARRRVGAIVREWRESMDFAQLVTREELRRWLTARLWAYRRKHNGTRWPTDRTMLGWAERLGRK
jgi:hypothetical protein